LLVKQRSIISGNVTEIMDFTNPIPIQENIIYNPYGRKGTISSKETQEEKEEKQKNNRLKTLKRNTTAFWRLYNCNANKHKDKDKFLTLTFRTLPDSIKECDRQLSNFFKRLMRYISRKIEYQGIRELQLENDRQGNHYHIIIYNMPYVKHSELLKLWCVGNPFMDSSDGKLSGVNIKAIDDGMNDITSYLTSYLLKEIIENDFLEGHKIIIQSKNLLKPVKINYHAKKYEPQIDEIKKALSFIDNKITYYRLK